MQLSDSTDLFQRLSLDGTLRRAMAVYRQGFCVFCQLGLLVMVVKGLLWTLLLPILLPAFGVTDPSLFNDPDYLVQHVLTFYGLLGINMVVSMIVAAAGMAATVRAVADLYLQKPPSFLDCLQIGARHACSILMANVLKIVGVLIGYMLLFVPGLYLAVAWFLVNPAIVLEAKGVTGSIGRSYELVAGEWCYVFCTFLIPTLVMVVIQGIWSAMMAGGNDASHTIFSTYGSFVAAVPEIVATPFFSIMMTIMYINLRVQKEGLTATQLAKDLGESSGDAAAYTALLEDPAVVAEQV